MLLSKGIVQSGVGRLMKSSFRYIKINISPDFFVSIDCYWLGILQQWMSRQLPMRCSLSMYMWQGEGEGQSRDVRIMLSTIYEYRHSSCKWTAVQICKSWSSRSKEFLCHWRRRNYCRRSHSCVDRRYIDIHISRSRLSELGSV